jgi:hypothetical protein
VTPFRRTFFVWFASCLALFIALNLAGFVLHGSKVHAIGFPCAVVEWIEIGEYRSETDFRPSAIAVNIAVALGISATLALVCATARRCKNR